MKRFGIAHGLVESVVLHPIDGGFEIEIVGEIARMAALGASGGNNKAAL